MLGIPNQYKLKICDSIPGGVQSMVIALLELLNVMAPIFIFEPP